MVKKRPKIEGSTPRLRMYLIPCSCGNSFAVSGANGYLGSGWSRFPACPTAVSATTPKIVYWSSDFSTRVIGKSKSADLDRFGSNVVGAV